MYLVTGVTGNVGREVATQILERGEEVRGFTREAGKVGFASDRMHVVKCPVQIENDAFDGCHMVSPG